MFDFSKLLDIHYLVEPNPTAQFAFKILFLSVFGLIILVAVLLWIAAHYLVKIKTIRLFLQTRAFYLLLTIGIGGLLLTFFRLAGANYLSMRLLFVIFLISMLAWLIYLLFYLVVTFPQKYREEKDQARRAKYLPKRKLK